MLLLRLLPFIVAEFQQNCTASVRLPLPPDANDIRNISSEHCDQLSSEGKRLLVRLIKGQTILKPLEETVLGLHICLLACPPSTGHVESPGRRDAVSEEKCLRTLSHSPIVLCLLRGRECNVEKAQVEPARSVEGVHQFSWDAAAATVRGLRETGGIVEIRRLRESLLLR